MNKYVGVFQKIVKEWTTNQSMLDNITHEDMMILKELVDKNTKKVQTVERTYPYSHGSSNCGLLALLKNGYKVVMCNKIEDTKYHQLEYILEKEVDE